MDPRAPQVEHIRMIVAHEWREYWLGRHRGDLSIHDSERAAREWVEKKAG